MPMTKAQAVKTELMKGVLNGSDEAAKIVSSLAKAKRLGTLDQELAELAKQMPNTTKEAVKDE